MSTIHINSSSKSAIVSNCSEGVFFDDFFSKNAIGRNGTNNYIQDVSNDFSACSFTGKERDEETGYGYFGARYMDHELMTMWLSVDPMVDKYPSISPYAYCAWNSVKLVDPLGEEALECDDQWQFNTSTGQLTWMNDDGGLSHQTVEMVHNQAGNTVVDQTVSFSGAITRMFDCSVISPTADGIVSGGLDIATGVTEAGAGLALGVGISAVSGGMATPLGMTVGGALVAVGGSDIALGFRDVMASAEGHPNISAQHNYIKDACKSAAGIAFSVLKDGKNGIKCGMAGFAITSAWSYFRWHCAAYPSYKGIPKGATVK